MFCGVYVHNVVIALAAVRATFSLVATVARSVRYGWMVAPANAADPTNSAAATAAAIIDHLVAGRLSRKRTTAGSSAASASSASSSSVAASAFSSSPSDESGSTYAASASAASVSVSVSVSTAVEPPNVLSGASSVRSPAAGC